jgi:Domain of unknown function (DUF4352)
MSHSDPSQPAQPQWQHPNARVQTEWQRVPSPPLPQDPLYQQTFHPRPPEKRARGGLLITIGAVVAMLALLGFAIGLQNHLQPATPKPATSSKRLQQPTPTIKKPTPQPVLVIQAIGKPVVVDSTWTVTVNGVKTSPGDRFSTPQAGDVYLVVDVTVKNTSPHHQDMLSGNQIVLKDSAGQQYMEAITDFATPPDGTIRSGGFQRGQLAYEIPATMHGFFYFFQADVNGADLTEWALHV